MTKRTGSCHSHIYSSPVLFYFPFLLCIFVFVQFLFVVLLLLLLYFRLSWDNEFMWQSERIVVGHISLLSPVLRPRSHDMYQHWKLIFAVYVCTEDIPSLKMDDTEAERPVNSVWVGLKLKPPTGQWFSLQKANYTKIHRNGQHKWC